MQINAIVYIDECTKNEVIKAMYPEVTNFFGTEQSPVSFDRIAQSLNLIRLA